MRHPLRKGLNQQVYKIDEMEQRVLPFREKLLTRRFELWLAGVQKM